MSGGSPQKKNAQNDVVTIKPEDFVRESSVFRNISQQVIVTTSDKIKLCLIEHQNTLSAKNGWIAPIGLLIALVTALVTTDFKQFLDISPDIWKALFIFGTILSAVWTIRSLFRLYQFRNKGGIDSIIEELKKRD
jgi:hypothetical protein